MQREFGTARLVGLFWKGIFEWGEKFPPKLSNISLGLGELFWSLDHRGGILECCLFDTYLAMVF